MFYIDLYRAKQLNGFIRLANKYIFHGELEKIIEVTYSYREIGENTYFNETLFEEYTGYNLELLSLSALKRLAEKKLEKHISYIDTITSYVQTLEIASRYESLRRGMFIDALEYVRHILNVTLL